MTTHSVELARPRPAEVKRLAIKLGTSSARVSLQPLRDSEYRTLCQAAAHPYGRFVRPHPCVMRRLLAYGLATQLPHGEHEVKHYITELGALTVDLNDVE